MNYSGENMALKNVIIDPGHGGTDSGAVSGTGPNMVKEAVLTRQIAKYLLDSLNKEGKVNAVSSFEIGKQDINSYWGVNERRTALSKYALNNPIDYIISIHINSSTASNSSGLVVCHNDRLADATVMYDTMVAYAGEKGYDLIGNRQEREQPATMLALLRVRAKDQTFVPALLVENGFISNSGDRSNETCDPEVFGEGIKRALYKIFKIE